MDRQAYLLDGAGNLLDTYTLSGWVHVALTADGTAGVAASPHEVIGILTATTEVTASPTPPAPETPTPTTPAREAATPTTPTPEAATPAAPAPLPEEGPGLPLLLVGLLGCSVAVGAGYLHWQRRQASPVVMEEEEEEAPAEEPAPPEVVEAPPVPWQASLEQGQTREAARVLSREMTALIKKRTGARILCAADALAACPGQRQDLARFFEDADRLAYASDHPAREEVEALAAVYLRLAEEIR